MIGRQFMWANNLPNPTFEKLDRVLMDANWESKFPMVSVRALERIEGFLDHAPILLTTGTPKPPGNHKFKFELGWLLTRVNLTNVLDEGLRIGGVGHWMNSKVKSVKQGVYRK
jgi:hypothetical protein